MQEQQHSLPFIQKLVCCKKQILLITNSGMVLQLNLKTQEFRKIQSLESNKVINCFHSYFGQLSENIINLQKFSNPTLSIKIRISNQCDGFFFMDKQKLVSIRQKSLDFYKICNTKLFNNFVKQMASIHYSYVNLVVFNSSGTILASGSRDNTIKL
eukprot:TRINITY_DN8519_c0_g1_i7.p2 TRINITY_DN8519_c0_g1~~TRINITY_DN8519_c0_g1_i7.p2  ORF type:complete len:156 (-),score=10.55 TRINITY_DN8519_c0_g1_i7:84-551(-)